MDEKGDGVISDGVGADGIGADGIGADGGIPDEIADCANIDERGDCDNIGDGKGRFNGIGTGGINDARSELYGVGLIGQRSDVGGSKSHGKSSSPGAAH